MASASRQTGSQAAVAKAAFEAFEAALDTVVALGWAYTEQFCFDNFSKVKSFYFVCGCLHAGIFVHAGVSVGHKEW